MWPDWVSNPGPLTYGTLLGKLSCSKSGNQMLLVSKASKALERPAVGPTYQSTGQYFDLFCHHSEKYILRLYLTDKATIRK